MGNRWVRYAEGICVAVLLAWLAWVPLPFGSVIERARRPLILVPLATCLAASLIRLYATRDRNSTARPTTAWRIWAIGAIVFLAVGALQLVPLAPALLGALSPESLAIWSDASRIVSLAGAVPRTAYPITVDPHATASELLRLAAIFAAFTTAALLIRNHDRRRVFAFVLCAAAIFEAMYGLRAAALQRYEIWGWVNRLIFHRVTGTFVNPNHFAHYIAIILPLVLFLGATLWRRAGSSDVPFAPRLAAILDRHALQAGFVALATIICLAAILLSQSRGALVAVTAAFLGVAAMLPGRRFARLALGGMAGVMLIAALALFLGPERTIRRFTPAQLVDNAAGRRIAVSAALGIWNRFPLFGSGLGTFERVVSLEQSEDLGRNYHHAHNDYAEIAATSGAVGFVVALVTLAGGFIWLVRHTFGELSRDLTWMRRAYQAAALVSISIALVQALFDFNLFISANPATLAAIAGTAVASVDHDKRTSRRVVESTSRREVTESP